MSEPAAVIDLAQLHRRALAGTGAYIYCIQASQWEAPTPCPEMDVRALVTHLVSGNLWVAPLVAGQAIVEVGDRFDGDVLGDDAVGAYRAAAANAAAAFDAPGAMEAMVGVSYGPVPGSVYAGHRFLDVLVHGWDLAVATGQDTTLDPELVEACWGVVAPQLDLLRASGMFGPEPAPVADDAGPQARLLAALGRRPAGP